MKQWASTVITALVGLVAAPIGVEAAICWVKDEPYSFRRAGVVLGFVVLAIVVLVLLGLFASKLRRILEVALLITGVAAVSAGVAIVVRGSGGIAELGVAVTGIGLLTTALAGSALYVAVTGVALNLAARPNRDAQTDVVYGEAGHRIVVRRFSRFASDDEEVLALCKSVMNPDDVHFLGYYVAGKCRFHIDTLDDGTLSRFLRGVNREVRRSVYERAGRQLSWVMDELNTYTKKLDGGILIRTILDVEQGALYYYWIGDGVYLTAVTMDQSKVLDADEKLRRLANKVGVLPRGASQVTLPHPRVPQVITQDGLKGP
jgi:hypothetical protein